MYYGFYGENQVNKWNLINKHCEINNGIVTPFIDLPKLRVHNQLRYCAKGMISHNAHGKIKDYVNRRIDILINQTLRVIR